DPDSILLPGPNGDRWLRGQHRDPFGVAVQRAKLPAGTVFYSLRHTYASAALVGGINMQLLAENMGTSVRMLEENYGKFTAASRRKLIEKSAFRLGLSMPNVAPMRSRRR